MREILFRGKSIESFEHGRWNYGFYTNEEYNEVYETPCSEVKDHYIENQDDTIRVAPETIGQYTGLKDKNGKRIFEGDIVKITRDIWHGEHKKVREEQIGLVVYGAKHCQFGLNIKGYSSCLTLNRWKGDYNEVIGNIHDNPELLEEEHELNREYIVRQGR